MFHVNANAKSVVQYAIHEKNGIIINANVSVKSIVRTKKIIVRIVVHVFVNMVSS